METALAILLVAVSAALLALAWRYRVQTRRLSEAELARHNDSLDSDHRGELLKAISAAATDAIVWVDSAARVAFVNDAARTLWSIENAIGKPLDQIAWGFELKPLVDQVQRNSESVDQILSKGERAFAVHVQSVGTASEHGVLIRANEITELQRLGRARRDFVANISHELRTPVASLQLLLDTISEEALDDKAFVLGLLGKMHLQIDLLRQLTDELMDLALIESGQAPIKLIETRAQELVKDAAEAMRPQAELKGIYLSAALDSDPLVLADPQAIRKVLGNLIHNAIKFSNSGGQIEVRVSPSEENVQFSVSDTGIGIPGHDLPRVFERFYKVDRARARDADGLHGTGLGLAIAKHIVTAHGGSIWAESVERKGSTFFFTLPAAN